MFDNAKTYNQEDSWVYQDAVEMQKVLESVFHRRTIGSGLPGAKAGNGRAANFSVHEDDDDVPRAPRASKLRKQVTSDGSDYNGGSDNE